MRPSREKVVQSIRADIVDLDQEITQIGDERYNIHAKKQLIRKKNKLEIKLQDVLSGKEIHSICLRSYKFLHHEQKRTKTEFAPHTTIPADAKDSVDVSAASSSTESPACDEKCVKKKRKQNSTRSKSIKKSVFSGSVNPTAILSVDTGGNSAEVTCNKNLMLDEYTQKTSRSSPSVYILPHLKCSKCGIHMHKLIDASVMVCPDCGLSTKYLDSSSKSLGYNDDIEYVTFSYKRQNHFQEWLNAFQGRENTVIPDDVIQKVMECLYMSGIQKPDDVSREHIRQILKEQKMRRYYDNVTSIMCQITGRQPIRLNPDKEEQLKLMFMSIQRPFNKHRPPTRKNFLSYSYVLFKFCELLGLDHLLHCFRLLKGREKLFKQDQIFKKICGDLKWEFIPSI